MLDASDFFGMNGCDVDVEDNRYFLIYVNFSSGKTQSDTLHRELKLAQREGIRIMTIHSCHLEDKYRP